MKKLHQLKILKKSGYLSSYNIQALEEVVVTAKVDKEMPLKEPYEM